MSKFSQTFQYDDLEDPIDLVLATDHDIDAAIEKAEEKADSSIITSDELIETMKENGDLCKEIDNEDEAMMYDEDEDDAIDIADRDAQTFRETFDMDVVEDDAEDDVIDTVIAADPQAPVECDEEDC